MTENHERVRMRDRKFSIFEENKNQPKYLLENWIFQSLKRKKRSMGYR